MYVPCVKPVTEFTWITDFRYFFQMEQAFFQRFFQEQRRFFVLNQTKFLLGLMPEVTSNVEFLDKLKEYLGRLWCFGEDGEIIESKEFKCCVESYHIYEQDHQSVRYKIFDSVVPDL